ncbi:aryl-alcohol dehydrogenase-like predicted oxidoreductase [Caballeronia udeis]|uniref:Aryl-alcohol dehydrogenase-like predicted oxidoreductase n=1 Tax=Caballeronia udeis TaxID=1232866 RepID=A0ABW8MCC8_9BURK
MKYINFGNTGLQVSRLCLGCMSFGDPQSGTHEWTLDEGSARPIFRAALEAGVNFFDTANSYSAGTSEQILGKMIREYARRDEVVIATKVYWPMRPDVNGRGLSRKAIMTEVDASLRRLGTDYIDLYQMHRWDNTTPIEETLEALHDVVKAGKVRYLGASSMFAWQFSKALYVARLNGWTLFVSMQNHLNLLYREEEREMLGLCNDQGIAVMPWSPLARGKLTRPWQSTPATVRDRTDAFSRKIYSASEEQDHKVVDALGAVAHARGLPHAQVALAWLLDKRGVTTPIIGASKLQHLQGAVAALDVQLSQDEIAALQAPYVPHEIAGFG